MGLSGGNIKAELGASRGTGLAAAPAAVALHEPFADREPDARGTILVPGMQSLEDAEDTFRVGRFDADPAVCHPEAPGPVPVLGRHLDPRRVASPELDGVRQQVLKHLTEAAFVRD